MFFDNVIIFLNDVIKFARFGPKSNCPYLLKDEPFNVGNFKLSCLKSKIRKSKINFHQSFNLVISLITQNSKFVDSTSAC